MGKARRKRGLIAIEAIRGTDIEELVKRYKLSGKRIRKAIKSGLEANGLPSDNQEALRESLAQLREMPEQAIEQIKRRTGLSASGSNRKKPAAKSAKSTQAVGKSGTAGQKKQAAPAVDSEEPALATRLKNLLVDTQYATDGEIDREAVAKASLEDLQELPGCGKASAEKILVWAQG